MTKDEDTKNSTNDRMTDYGRKDKPSRLSVRLFLRLFLFGENA